MKLNPVELAGMGVCTVAAILVHGYHPYVEDAAIYVPGIKKLLDPSLYPCNQEFFASHAGMTIFPNLIAAIVRTTHLSLDWVLLLCHAASIFFLLLGCWRIAQLCFEDRSACWGSVVLAAALLTLPVAGTSLYVMDQYLTPRSFSIPVFVFSVAFAVERKSARVMCFSALAAIVHPLMALFGFCFAAMVAWTGRTKWLPLRLSPALGILLPFIPIPSRDGAPFARDYFFVTRWHWYEWLGIFGPLVLLWWFERIAKNHEFALVQRLCRALIVFEIVFLPAGLLVRVPAFTGLARFQPMRSLHAVYLLLVVLSGGLLGQFWFRKSTVRWVALLVPLCAGMFLAQRQIFPATRHLELPGRSPANAWVESFLWIHEHTPKDAYFAMDPTHMELPGEDEHGFRAIAERSMLADELKDSGVVSMFPCLAKKWQQQVHAQSGWENFTRQDFERLHQQFRVDWFVLTKPSNVKMECPYQNQAVKVCYVDE